MIFILFFLSPILISSSFAPLHNPCNTAKNELFHLCAEAAETGDVGPMLEDVTSMLVEDVLDFDSLSTTSGCTNERRHRTLHQARARAQHAISFYSSSRTADHRGRRALRQNHPRARRLHGAAPRARHLRYNHFTRPPRRRHLQNECSSTELLDGLLIKGGYDGTQIFFKLELDVSKENVGDPRDVILRPLHLLSEADFLKDLNLFEEGSSVVDSIFDNIDADISFLAGAHMGATGRQWMIIINGITALISTHTWFTFCLLFLCCNCSWV